jgi:hypothetical protein
LKGAFEEGVGIEEILSRQVLRGVKRR